LRDVIIDSSESLLLPSAQSEGEVLDDDDDDDD